MLLSQQEIGMKGSFIMARVLIVDAGLKPGWTKAAADRLAELLQKDGSIEIDRVNLREEQIAPCTGCAICLERGEQKCRNHSDSADKIIGRMLEADGIITVSPNYSLQVPALLKNMYDRLAYVFHRPRLFGRLSMAVVVQGVYGGGKVVSYINEIMAFWGAGTMKGAVVSGALYPSSRMDQKVLDRRDAELSKAAARFAGRLRGYRQGRPSLFRLAIFRMTRSSMKYSPEALAVDRKYFEDNGWLESGYYYDVRLDPVSLVLGNLIDRMIKRMVSKVYAEPGQVAGR